MGQALFDSDEFEFDDAVPDAPPAVGPVGLGGRAAALPEAEDMDNDPAMLGYLGDEPPADPADDAEDVHAPEVIAAPVSGAGDIASVERRLAAIEERLERLAVLVEPIAGDQRVLLQAVFELTKRVTGAAEKSAAVEVQARDIRDRLATFDADFRALVRAVSDVRVVINGFVGGRAAGASKAADKGSDAKPIDMADLLGR